MGVVRVKMKLKNDGLNQSLRMLGQKSQRLPSYLVNKACLSIAIRADRAMPVVSPAQISSEMDSITRPKLTKGTKNHPPRPYKSGETYNDVVEGGTATRIVLARLWPGSPFNIRTGNVFALDRENFSRGTGQAGFLKKVLESATRMVGARRSSSGFFKVCAKAVMFVFQGATSKSRVAGLAQLQEGFEATAGSGNVSKNIGRLAGGTPAYGVRDDARATFWVAATEPDTKGEPSNRGIFGVAQPVWQKSVDEESVAIRDYAETLYKDAVRKSGLEVT